MSCTLTELLKHAGLEDSPLLEAAARMAPWPLFPSQERALRGTNLLTGASTLILAPTGTGKTLLADAAALMALARRQTVLHLVSTRSLARERAARLSAALGPSGYRIASTSREERSHDNDIRAGRIDVIVAVYEKARALHLATPGLLASVGLVVADEFQLLQQPDRGLLAELMLACWRAAHPALQLLALSAGSEELEAVANRLDLQVFSAGERVVPLRQGLVDLRRGIAAWNCESTGEQGTIHLPGVAENADSLEAALPHLVAALTAPVLLFAPTRRDAFRIARLLSEGRHLSHKPVQGLPDGTESGNLLAEILPRGVALHTAELTRDQRAIVEYAIRSGTIDCCVATTTLAEGVNLPIHTVLVLCGSRPPAALHNLFGRAGRPETGIGHAFLVPDDRLTSPPVDKYKSLSHRGRVNAPLSREAAAYFIATHSATTPTELIRELNSRGDDLDMGDALIEQGFAEALWNLRDGTLQLLPVGEILAAGGLDPQTISGWRTLLRRFGNDASPAAATFLAIGGSPVCRVISRTPEERQCRRWIAELVDELTSDRSPLARYFIDLLLDGENYPRSLHQGAKGTLLFLARSRGKSLASIEETFAVSAGVIEDFCENCHHHLAQAHRLASLMGTSSRSPEDSRSVYDGVPNPPQTIASPNPPVAPPTHRLVITRGSTGLVRFDGAEVALTRCQFRMLELLSLQAGEGVPYERLERYVWPDACVERQQVFYHRRRLEEKLLPSATDTGTLIETFASWGLRLRLRREEILFDEQPAPALLERSWEPESTAQLVMA